MEQTVLAELAELPKLPYAALKDRWRSLYGTEPPRYSRAYMIRRLAYRVQELAYGGLSDWAKAELERIADEDERTRRTKRRKRNQNLPVAGTRLIREWHGQRHEVTVTYDGGLDYRGKRYKTLTAVAKVITGAHWSGPCFFGLQQKASR